MTFKIANAVRPLIHLDNGKFAFAGTGFFISHYDRIFLITANHVIKDYDICIFDEPDDDALFDIKEMIIETEILARDKNNDLAILNVKDFSPDATLTVAENLIAPNMQVGSLEYARFSVDPAGGKIDFGTSTRLGNVVRYISEERFPSETLELSYPALRGSSGAPVISMTTLEVIGVIIANIQYELLPVQKIYYKSEESAEEEITHYYLPAGLAINCLHLKALLETLQ